MKKVSDTKIAILTESVFSHSGSRIAIELAKNLKKANYDVTIYAKTAEDSILTAQIKKMGIKITICGESKLSSRFLPNLTLLKLLKVQNPKVAFLAASPSFLLAAKLARVPVVRIYMGTQFNAYLENKLPRQINFFDRLINFLANCLVYLTEFTSVWLSDRIIAISNFCQDEVRRLYKRRASQTIYLGGNHLPRPNPSQTGESKEKKAFRIISVSRITPYKNFHLLIEALKMSRHKKAIQMEIIGASPKKHYLSYLKKIAPKNVQLRLNVSDSGLARLYQQSDLYITADRYLFFGFPIVEIAFFQKPSIAFDFAAASEIIKNGQTGFIVKNGQEMAAKIDYLFENRPVLKQLGKNAFVQASKLFGWNKISQKYVKLLEQFIEN